MFRKRRIAPLRSLERIVGGYATLAFGLAAAEGVAMKKWLIAAASVVLSAAGAALLAHDHRRWRRRD